MERSIKIFKSFEEQEEYYHAKPDENWQTVLSLLSGNLDSEIQFKQYTKVLKDFGVMGLDDYSVIRVKF